MNPKLKLDPEEKLLRDSLYKYCCLSNTTLEYNDIKSILQDYQTIENKYVDWYKKLEYDPSGRKTIKVDDEKVTVDVCSALKGGQTDQVNHYKKFKCLHQHHQATPHDNYVKCDKCSQIRLDFIHYMSGKQDSDHEIRFEILWKWKFLAMARVRMIWFENSLFNALEQWTLPTEKYTDLNIKPWTQDPRSEADITWLSKQLLHWKTN